MRITIGLMAALLFAGWCSADTARSTKRFDFEGFMARQKQVVDREKRAVAIYPRRRDTPLRVLNITDEEIREVQALARKYEMSELMNISPVVMGCPCEEGGSCTEQVYIVSESGD